MLTKSTRSIASRTRLQKKIRHEIYKYRLNQINVFRRTEMAIWQVAAQKATSPRTISKYQAKWNRSFELMGQEIDALMKSSHT